MWTRKSRRRPSRRQTGRWGAHAAQAKGRPTNQADTRQRRTLWRRALMRLRALWRWGAGKLLRRFFGRTEGATGQGPARVHLLPEQRHHRY